ncbi:unnamed protein product [Haemonchus placei]|uniref:DUF4158 domain-containing protein n=1 Tax=Haemonchus placei TaxID=6290 RepID=A0A0N4VSW7_HAEPC|nr:unnamed protein product [Haemonchus placei]
MLDTVGYRSRGRKRNLSRVVNMWPAPLAGFNDARSVGVTAILAVAHFTQIRDLGVIYDFDRFVHDLAARPLRQADHEAHLVTAQERLGGVSLECRRNVVDYGLMYELLTDEIDLDLKDIVEMSPY